MDKQQKAVKEIMSKCDARPIPAPPTVRRSKESHELMRLIKAAALSGIRDKVMSTDDALCALMGSTLDVALRVMPHADVADWLGRVKAVVETEIESGAGKPS